MTQLLFNDFAEASPADVALAVAAYHKLEQHYPGHSWRTNADHAQGVLTVQLQYFDKLRRDANWGVRIKIHRLNSDPDLRSVVRAGGELLERYGLPRHRRADAETRVAAVAHGLDKS